MNKQLSMAEVDALMESVIPKPVTLTRKQKLWRWADAIRLYGHRIRMMHEVEYMTSFQLAKYKIKDSIFDVAAKDPVLAAAGLKNSDALSGKEFFELGKPELHFIACDCQGEITNLQMANRVARIADTSERNFMT